MRAVCATMKRDLDTERAYLSTLRRYFDFITARPELRGVSAPDRVRAYLEAIAPNVAQSTQDGALHALRFFHLHILQRPLPRLGPWAQAKRAETIPNWLPHEDVMRVIGGMKGEKKLQAEICYGSGLRIEDVATLRIKGVDRENRRLIIHQGKGRKDRVTVLAESIIEPLHRQIEYARGLWQSDRDKRRPGVALPDTLEISRPIWGEEWAWFLGVPLGARIHLSAHGHPAPPSRTQGLFQQSSRGRGAQGRAQPAAQCPCLAPFLRHHLPGPRRQHSQALSHARAQGHSDHRPVSALRPGLHC